MPVMGVPVVSTQMVATHVNVILLFILLVELDVKV